MVNIFLNSIVPLVFRLFIMFSYSIILYCNDKIAIRIQLMQKTEHVPTPYNNSNSQKKKYIKSSLKCWKLQKESGALRKRSQNSAEYKLKNGVLKEKNQ